MFDFIEKNLKKLIVVAALLCITSLVCFIASLAVYSNAEYDGYESGFYYTYTDGGINLEHCDLKGDVVIPDEIGGYSVVSIGGNDNWASFSEHYAPFFYNAEDITSVDLPDTLVNISTFAFADCVNLDDLKIPSSVRYIGDKAFFNCSKLTSIVLPRGLTSMGWYAFTGSSFTNITLPNSVESIGFRAFYECSSLTSIIIPDSVTSIDQGAFENCSSLTSIIIPDSVTSIDRWAFRGCDRLTIYCEEESEPFMWDSDWNYSNCPVVWGYKGN